MPDEVTLGMSSSSIHKFIVIAAFGVLVAPRVASAQSETLSVVSSIVSMGSIVNASVVRLTAPAPAPTVPTIQLETKRPAALIPLYVSYAALQAFDVASTHRALANGAVEANPLVSPLLSNQASLVAMKAGSAAAVICASEYLWKRNKAAAIATMVAVNSAYAVIVAHNEALARR